MALVTALALIVRFSTLGHQSLWLDEAYTDHLVHLGFGSMLSEIPKSESTPPLYYILTWAWTHVFGYSAVALRSVSALSGAATAAVVYAVATRVGGLRAGVIAGVLVSVSPIMVWYSQEARSYALATLLASVGLLCLIVYRDTAGTRWLAGWAISGALGLCTHYFVVFVLAPEVVWLLWRARARKEVQAAVGLVVLTVLALVPLALAQRGTGHADYISRGHLAMRAAQVPKQLLLGYASPAQAVTVSLAAVLVLVGALWPLVRDRTRIDRALLLALAAGLSCVVLPLLLALAGIDFLNTRNVLPALPSLLVVVGVGFALPRAWPLGGVLAAALALLFAVVVVLVETNIQYQRDDWRGASQALGFPVTDRVIVLSPGSGQLPLGVYQPGLRQLGPGGARVSELDLVALSAPASVGGGLATAPRPSGPVSVPPGFHMAGRTYDRVYTIVRFTSAVPVRVEVGALAASRIAPGAEAILLQSPGSEP
jgi:mannosyltransferase